MLTFSYSLLSPNPQPGLHLLCFRQIELLLLLLQLQWGQVPPRQLRHTLLVQQLPLHRPRDPHILPIQDIPGKTATEYLNELANVSSSG